MLSWSCQVALVSFILMLTILNHSTDGGTVLVQSAESIRARAEEAITCIQYMQNFAACTDFGELPDLFQDSARLSEAAVGRLLMHSCP